MTTNVKALIDQMGELYDTFAKAKKAYEDLRDAARDDLGVGKFEGDRYIATIYDSKGQVLVDKDGKEKLKELTSPQYYAAHTTQAEFVAVKMTTRKV
jgi:hypothetical protein